jgi:hypothetical protein
MAAIAHTNSASAPPAAIDGLRDIKPPIEIPTGWEWLWWMLGALALIAILTGLALFIFRRRKQVNTPPPIPAHIRARQKLDDALKLLSQPKPFVTAVSDTLRGYLEERFSFHAPERTTEEFLHELKATQLLAAGQKESLSHFLQSCDLVKFAKYEPTEEELRALHAAALRLVDETEPKPIVEGANAPTETGVPPIHESK